MSNLASSIVLGASLLASGCSVHHHHHHAEPKYAHKSDKAKHCQHGAAHASCPGARELPEGHPPISHGMDPHHGKRAHGMDPHHGKRAHGMDPHHGKRAHGSQGPKNPFHEESADGEKAAGHEHHAQHEGMQSMPAPVQVFHDAFAAAWHLESDDERKKTACAEIANWKQLAVPVKAHKLEGAGAAGFASAANDLGKKLNVVGFACNRKKGDVQSALKDTHDALHALFKALQTSTLD